MAFEPKASTGYAEDAALLYGRYEELSFEDVHRAVMHLLPVAPARILDVGAGSGRDAAWLAKAGHRIVAVEPTPEFRKWAAERHSSPRIEWVDDALPELKNMVARVDRYDCIMITAVWMHLDPAERHRSMEVVAGLLKPSGLLIMSLRHGPAPPNRRVFEVSPSETIAQAAASNLSMVLCAHTPSAGEANRRAGITWTRLAFRS